MMSILEDEAMAATKDPTMNIAWNIMKLYWNKSVQAIRFL
jgi:hypothetical protein